MIQRRETLEDVLSVIESLYEEGKVEQASSEVRRARAKFPESPTLLEWEAVLSSDEGHYLEALYSLGQALRREPGRRFALREQANVLQELGRFEDALEVLERVGPDGDRDAGFYYYCACCLDRQGRQREADAHFGQAAKLAPESYAVPLRLGRQEFEHLVLDALRDLPAGLQERLARARLSIEDYPRFNDPDPYLLGIFYRGRGDGAPGSPEGDRLTLFKRNLEVEFQDLDALREEVRRTVAHEIVHFHGLEKDWEMYLDD